MFTLSDFFEMLTIAGGIVGALIAGGRWLLGIWHEKEEEIAKLKSTYRENEIKEIKETIASLKLITTDHAAKIQAGTLALEKSYMRYNAQADSVKHVADEIKSVSRDMREDVKQMNSVLLQVTQDVAILKTRKH